MRTSFSIGMGLGMNRAGGGASPPPTPNLGIQFATGASYLSRAIAPNVSGSYSFMGWFRYADGPSPGVGNMLALWNGSGFDPGQCLQIYAGSGAPEAREVSVYIAGGTPDTISSFGLVSDWFHVALSGPGPGGVWTLFINSVAFGTIISPALDVDGLFVGSCFGGETFTGAATSVKHGPVLVNAAEVAAEMATRSAVKAGLTAYPLNGADDLNGFTLNGSASSIPGPFA